MLGAEKEVTILELNERIAERRKAAGLTQEQLGALVGVTRQAVSKWETGAADPSTSNLLALAKLFGAPAEELLWEMEREKDDET